MPTQALLAIGLGFFIQWAWESKKAIRWAAFCILFLTVALNLWQSRQFRKSIIDQDRMTRAVYKKGFFAHNKHGAWERILLPWRAGPNGDSIPYLKEYKSRPFRVLDAEQDVPNTDTIHVFEGRRSQRIDQASPYSMGVMARYDEITAEDHAWLRITAQVWPEDQAAAEGIRLVAHFEHEGKPFHYTCRRPKKGALKVGEWNAVEFLYQTAEIRDPADNLKTFFWMTKPGVAWVDDFRIQIMERP